MPSSISSLTDNPAKALNKDKCKNIFLTTGKLKMTY